MSLVPSLAARFSATSSSALIDVPRHAAGVGVFSGGTDMVITCARAFLIGVAKPPHTTSPSRRRSRRLHRRRFVEEVDARQLHGSGPPGLCRPHAAIPSTSQVLERARRRGSGWCLAFACRIRRLMFGYRSGECRQRFVDLPMPPFATAVGPQVSFVSS